MRILHCIPSMLGGGAERQLAYLAAEQSKRGYQVDVALLFDGPNGDRLRCSGVTIHSLSHRGIHDPYLMIQLIRLIRSTKPDIVQTWLRQMDILGGVVARWTRVPWILSERSSALGYPHSLKNRLRVWLGLRAQAIVSNSTGGDTYWESYGCARARRHVIHNGLPWDEIDRVPSYRPDSGAVAEGQKIVLYAGRMSSGKNVNNMISGIRGAAVQVPLSAYMCGEGVLQPEVKNLIHDNRLSGLISLQGYVTNVWSWMKGADVFISLSLTEGQPNAVLEAIACGCPVVLSDIPAHREIVCAEMALFVNPHSPAQISEALISTLTAPGAARRRAESAKGRIADHTIPGMADAYEEVYREIAAGRNPLRGHAPAAQPPGAIP
jgi:glycosyltransferase involved in cell wall biosynthesis